MFVAAFGLALVSACKKSKEPVPTTETCDTNPKNYNTHVKPIMTDFCTGCHKPGGAFSSLPLTTYAEVKNATLNGKLLPSIKHQSGAEAMPLGGGKLSDANIAIIDCWVSKGYPEN